VSSNPAPQKDAAGDGPATGGKSGARAGASAGPLHIAPRGDGPAPLVFRQGAHPPFAIRWYGVTSLFGHFRNFIASAIATESIDSRDWMRPLEPSELLHRIARALGGDVNASTLAGAVGRPLWIDFAADPGDDRDVSHAVGKMMFAEYTVNDGTDGTDGAGGATLRTLPRGDVLLLGGDTAYPVATAEEIWKRVIQPWNEALRDVEDREEEEGRWRPRVLLGIPGNHDWYDGLDGFARMFRRGMRGVEGGVTQTTEAPRRPRRREAPGARQVGLVARQLHLDEVGGLFKLVTDGLKSLRAFARGVGVKRRGRLTLSGYESVQETSFWAVPLAPGMDLWGVDRQLGRLDFRQRGFFQARRREEPEATVVFIAPDPAVAFGERNEPGARMLSACKLSLERDRMLYLCGDLHHYERREIGASTHVIAGGGGAFLHGTRVSPGVRPAAAAYPNAAMTATLLAQVPLRLMLGRAGFLVHLGLALIASIELGSDMAGTKTLIATSWLVSIGVFFGLYALGGHHRNSPRRVALTALPFSAAIGFLPTALKLMLPRVIPTLAGNTAVMLVHALVGSFLFGLFLATIATAGFEMQQAFTVLGHPGFKHFVRMCVSPSGRIDAWVIAKDDMLAPGPPAIVDHWSFDGAPHARTAAEEDAVPTVEEDEEAPEPVIA
jgi:hypothetical protein